MGVCVCVFKSWETLDFFVGVSDELVVVYMQIKFLHN